MKSYFGRTGGIFFPFGLYHQEVSPSNNCFLDFMNDDGLNPDYFYQIGYPNMAPPAYPPQYHIYYNCIGWAFGINADIQPVFGEHQELVTLDSLPDFLNEKSVDYPDSIFLNNYLNESSMLFPYQLNNNALRIELSHAGHTDFILNYTPQVGDVIFYFGKNSDTLLETEKNVLLHAARYFETAENYFEWTSKLGDGLLLSHVNLEDVAGTIYGSPEIVLANL